MADMHAVPEQKPEPKALARPPLSFMPTSWDDAWRAAQYLDKSNLIPDALRNKVHDILHVLVTSAELGISPMVAVREIVVIKGRPYLSALLRISLVKQSPDCEYFRMVESSATKAVFETKRRGEGITRMEFTAEDAKRAGLLDRRDRDGKPITDDNWNKYLPLMLRRRCGSQLADEVYPDVTRGTRDMEELEEEREAAGVTATVTRIGVAPPPPVADQPAEPVPTPPKAEKVRRIPIVDVPAPAEVKAATDTITSSDMDRAGPPPVMSEFDIICAKLDECQTKQQVDDLSIAHVNYQGPGRDDLRKLFKAKRAELEKGGK
jgi:hypothetical protein